MGLFHSKLDSGSDDEWEPNVSSRLSHVGEAVYQELPMKYSKYRHKMWNATFSAMVGSLQQTPSVKTFTENLELTKDPPHSNGFVDKMFDVMSKTTKWCDFMSLAPPYEGGKDDYFLKKMKEALKNVAGNAKGKEPIIVRLMFGWGYGESHPPRFGPIDCDLWMKKFTEELPEDANIQLWVGAWRYGQSWNHAKIIAVDGKYLHTGGHNVWSKSYLENKPVHDISIEMEGHATHDAHLFSNTQWEWIQYRRGTFWGRILSSIPSWVPMLTFHRADISEYPIGRQLRFPPLYKRSIVDKYKPSSVSVPVFSVGRQAALVDGFSAFFSRDQPAAVADAAFVAMFGSATNTIRMSLQDLGPAGGPKYGRLGGLILGWPTEYFKPMVRAILKRGVVIQIVLSNRKTPENSFGYPINEVYSKIIKCMKKEFPNEVTNTILKEEIIGKKLCISYIRHKGGNTYYQDEKEEPEEDNEIYNHPKFIIIDDVCSYTGSQNLYRSDLAEWGIIIDDADITAGMMEDYWNPLWKASHNEDDYNVEKIMESLEDDTDNDEVVFNPYTFGGKKKIEEIVRALNEGEAPRCAGRN
ncbi:hypothetical protein FRACYDRAFT_251375 [Fragilariopsis cylindrus CCMP1102]|uniref:PLD phosphodiesterase domain-containing protein n=1 Tax=Fragilariopsis cylindrus CCMP1102 TaxID=635003 RepID=A0A1E7EN46_9STRA|nr:hypothetical protein FRACYDRAFT_251375 [Fragilariopsis cylindrus CCMP1102]|eukprot:OEU07264.1 hypothetical protein FRACYDRAFT_251375 [Fragilariopsis cylindrus CCMP1102]